MSVEVYSEDGLEWLFLGDTEKGTLHVSRVILGRCFEMAGHLLVTLGVDCIALVKVSQDRALEKTICRILLRRCS